MLVQQGAIERLPSQDLTTVAHGQSESLLFEQVQALKPDCHGKGRNLGVTDFLCRHGLHKSPYLGFVQRYTIAFFQNQVFDQIHDYPFRITSATWLPDSHPLE